MTGQQRFGIIILLMVFVEILFLAWLGNRAHAGEHRFLEKNYQQKWCAEHGGVTEYVLDDRTRVDCLTDDYAIEFDFARKWAESIGQARHYAVKTGRQPGVVLIVEGEKEYRFLWRLLKSIRGDRKQWAVWVIGPWYLEINK